MPISIHARAMRQNPPQTESRLRFVRSTLHEITNEELRRELQRRKEPNLETDFTEIGDVDLINEYTQRGLERYYVHSSLALDRLRYGIEDKDWSKVSEAYELFNV